MKVVKPSGNLKSYLDANKHETRLTGPIEQHLLTRPQPYRPTDILHPSALAKSDFCVREAYFVISGVPSPVPPEKVNLRLQSIFDEGHSIHAKWQNWLKEMGVLYGDWESSHGTEFRYARGHRVTDLDDPENWVYREVPLEDRSLTLAGHADGWVKGLGKDFLIEIKSIGTGTIRMENAVLFAKHEGDLDACWRDIRRPFPSHMRQGQLYLEMARKQYGDEAPTEMVFIYELKSNQAYKEFVVKADRRLIATQLDHAFDVTVALEKGIAPACNIDQNGCKRCQPYEA